MKIILIGAFDREDMIKIAKALRTIEQENPKNNYLMLMDDPLLSIKRASELVQEVYNASKKEDKK